MKNTLREATEAWVAQFTHVPASVMVKMARTDNAMRKYSSDSLYLVATPRFLCERCLHPYPGNFYDTCWPSCEICGYCLNWIPAGPSIFPCGNGTLFAPPKFDHPWFLKHKELVAALGFFVFESKDYGILLGFDAGGVDLYDAYWMPLYKIRWREATCQ